MFGSNAYLGLTNHPKVVEAAITATKIWHRYGRLVSLTGPRYSYRIRKKAC